MPPTYTFPVPLAFLENPNDSATERYALVDLEGTADTSVYEGGLLHLNSITGGRWDEKGNEEPLTPEELDLINGRYRSDKKLTQELEDAWTEKYWAQAQEDNDLDPVDAHKRRIGGVLIEDSTSVEIVSGPAAGKAGTVIQFVPASPDGGQEHYVVDVGEDQPVNVPEQYLRKQEKHMEDTNEQPVPAAVPDQPPVLAGLTTIAHLTAVDSNLIPTELLKGAEIVPVDESKMLFELPEEATPDLAEAKDAAKPAPAEIRNAE